MKASLPAAVAFGAVLSAQPPAVWLGNGLRVGEVDATSAVLWARVTALPEPITDGPEFVVPERAAARSLAAQLPDGRTLAQMRGALPGASGEIAFACSPAVTSALEWLPARAEHDFVVHHRLQGLRPATEYVVTAHARATTDGGRSPAVSARFRTAPEPGSPAAVRFALLTCQDAHNGDDAGGFRVLGAVRALAPDFVIHAGDFVYYDRAQPFATDVALARFHWHRMLGFARWRALAERTSFYHLKDDHDLLRDDCWPGQKYGELTFAQGQQIFREQTPIGDGPMFRTRSWGADLQLWFVEGRDHRSPNTQADGPDKTIWGQRQLDWFCGSVAASAATFKVLVSPTPIVGPDRDSKNDNHANAGFRHEGDRIRAFLAEHDVFVLCGDRHWQYASIDAETGVREFSAGATTDAHAGGFRLDQRSEEHDFLRIGGGFLEVVVERDGARATATVRHRDVEGAVCNEVVLTRSR